MTWSDDPGLTQRASNGTGHLLAEIHELRISVHGLEIQRDHANHLLLEIREEQKRMAEAITKAKREAEAAVDAINAKINSAILWLALGAGGLILQIIGPKLGLLGG